MAGHPPSGTVTFLLTDLEGSTRMWERHPDAMQAVMARHALANIDREFLTGCITVGTESIADA
jgi:class 3 adenylate cyclase